MTDPISVAYGAAAAAFVVGVAFAAVLYRSLDGSAHQNKLAALAVIPGFAGVSYVAMALGIGTVTVNGTEFVGFRYIDWIVTTPLLVGFVGYVAGASRRAIAGVMLADAMMIAVGAAAVLADGTLKWALFAVSGGFHLVLFAYLYLVFPKSFRTTRHNRGCSACLKTTSGCCGSRTPSSGWPDRRIGFAGAVGISFTYVFLDVLAKVPYVYFFYARRQAFADIAVTETNDGPTPAPAD